MPSEARAAVTLGPAARQAEHTLPRHWALLAHRADGGRDGAQVALGAAGFLGGRQLPGRLRWLGAQPTNVQDVPTTRRTRLPGSGDTVTPLKVHVQGHSQEETHTGQWRPGGGRGLTRCAIPVRRRTAGEGRVRAFPGRKGSGWPFPERQACAPRATTASQGGVLKKKPPQPLAAGGWESHVRAGPPATQPPRSWVSAQRW